MEKMTKNVMSVSKIPAELRREKQSKRHIKTKTIMYKIIGGCSNNMEEEE